jgi:large subunit ribosomal protein L29
MNIEEVRSKTDSELEYEIGQMSKELFELRFKAGVESIASPADISKVRRAIARVRTVLHERATGIRGQESR